MRKIDWDKALSEEDKAWARQAGLPMVEERIAANEDQFGQERSVDAAASDPNTKSVLDPSQTAFMPPDQAPPNGAPAEAVQSSLVDTDGVDYDDDYDDWKVAELKDEIAERNGQEDAGINVASDARKPDLIAALREDDKRRASEKAASAEG